MSDFKIQKIWQDSYDDYCQSDISNQKNSGKPPEQSSTVSPADLELADHYGTAIVPARIRRPQDKSHAEGSVSYASTWILAALRNDTFFSLADAKEAVAEKLEELNGYTFKKREGNRRDAYIHEE